MCLVQFPAQAIEADAAGFTLDLGWFRQHADPKILISINRMIMDPTATNESASQCMRRRDIWNDVALWGIDEDDEFGECSSDEGDSDIPETLIELPHKFQVSCRAHESVFTVIRRLRRVLNQTMLSVTTFSVDGTQSRTSSVPMPPLNKSSILGLSTAFGSHFVVARDGNRSIHWLMGRSGIPLFATGSMNDDVPASKSASLSLRVDVLMACNTPSQ
jgi:hypothetical protein